VSVSYHGTHRSAQGNGERRCWSHVSHAARQEDGGLKSQVSSPSTTALRYLERSRTLEPQRCIDRHTSRPKRSSSSSLPACAANEMLAQPASTASVRASHPSNHPSPAPTPGSIAICLLSHLPRSHSVPFVQHRNRISSRPAFTVHHLPSIHTTKRLSRHSTPCVPTTASPTRHHLRNQPLASALLLANFRPSSAPPTQRTHIAQSPSSSPKQRTHHRNNV
jgi:hypothetical protein